MSATSERTCIVCRAKVPRSELFRIVRMPDGNILFDAKAKTAGRGAYICKPEHLNDKSFVGRLGHALKCKVNADTIEDIKLQFAKELQVSL